MKIKLESIRPNPFRNFDLYPYDEEQIQRLQQSMDSLGFFSGVTARKSGGGYELAAGHHRLKAAERAGLDVVEAVVEPYTDDQMVDIMMVENMTQRGHNAASVLDSVAARCKVMAKDVLLGEGEVSKFLDSVGPGKLSAAQTIMAKDGPGSRLLYRAMNKFAKEDRRANKDAEMITSSEIEQALATLKTGGVMGRIMAGVYAEVEAIRAEKEAEEQAAREAEERRAAQAEAKRVAEAERKHTLELNMAEVAGRLDREAREAADKKAADAEKKARLAKEAQKQFEQMYKDNAAARTKAAKDREAAKEARDKQAAKDKAERERQDKERAAIKAQKALEAIYDPRCANVFRLTSHEKTFREAVLSANGRRFIPKENQLALARQIRKEIDETEAKRGYDLGSVTIGQMIEAQLARLIGLQRDIDKQEKDRLQRESAQKRVDELWATLRRGVQQSESALEKLVNEQVNWPYEAALFPMHSEDIDRVIAVGRRMQNLKKALGY